MKTLTERILHYALGGGLPVAIFLLSVFLGFLALQYTPREEEPQIVVPVIDVQVSAPGLGAEQVERQVTIHLEKLLSQIPGVEHVYSTSAKGEALVTLRFYVGEDREDSLLNTYNKLYSNQDKIPPVIDNWQVKPVEVDDVAVLVLSLWSENPERYDDYDLRRLAEEMSTFIQAIPNTSDVSVSGGRSRIIQVLLDSESLAARKTAPLDVAHAMQVSNLLTSAGYWVAENKTVLLESGDYFRSIEEIQNLVVNVIDGDPVFLKDVSTIVDGPTEADSYTWIEFTDSYRQESALTSESNSFDSFPMVSISVAKQRGTNAVTVTTEVHELIAQLQESFIPPEIKIEVMRDYGQTADEKVNSLVQSLAFAVFTVVVFIGVFLGWRQAAIIALAVPVCYGITLFLDMALGYTINRVTLFALILALGLLVDDPITGVDNITRFLSDKKSTLDFNGKIVAAITEIKTPLVLSTITIILAFIPLAFITGMMGPYMAPMAFNVPVSVITSTAVAFLVTPWLARKILKDTDQGKESEQQSSVFLLGYKRFLSKLFENRKLARLSLWIVGVLFIIACTLPMLRAVPLKLLPFDNKNEIQVLIDLPEGSSLETTAAVVRSVASRVRQIPEVHAIAAYTGIPSAIDFNGMVRQYYNREAPYFAELRLTLVDKSLREHQSHGIVLRMRELLDEFNQDGVSVKIVEVPPGPPVLSTLVAEVYSTRLNTYQEQTQAALGLMQRIKREAHVVEVDSTINSPYETLRFITDKQKAAISGISTEDISQTLSLANAGYIAGYYHLDSEAVPLPVQLRLEKENRTQFQDLLGLQVKGRPGVSKISVDTGLDVSPQPLVSLGEIGNISSIPADQVIYHKDLRPVVYVTSELSGRTPAEVIADISADQVPWGQDTDNQDFTDWDKRTFLSSGAGDYWSLPPGMEVKWGGEGEWKITIDVFRDMGIAFAFALVAIFLVLRLQTDSIAVSLIIMSSIPLTMIGIMPGFWLLNQFGERLIAGAPDPVLFTATAMIGMIALAGIVVRNSLILVEFITQARAQGMELKEALMKAGSLRMRPVLLTAGTTLLGNLVITLDPVFSGLALAIIFGIISSTLFTLVVVPVVYFLVFSRADEH